MLIRNWICKSFNLQCQRMKDIWKPVRLILLSLKRKQALLLDKLKGRRLLGKVNKP